MNKKAFFFFGFLFLFAGVGLGLVLFGSPENSGGASVLERPFQTEQTQTQPALSPEQKPEDSGTVPKERVTVKRTVDGDTLDVMIDGREEKVRLLGINTPESVDPRRPVECYGKEASKQMDRLATNHTVTMVSDPTNDDRDKYRRLLRYVYLEDGTFVNARMVEQGYAFAYTRYPFQYMEKFVELERIARSKELGLWNSSVCPYYTSK